MDYKHHDTLLILHYIQQHKKGTSVDAILQHSGAEKLRVYPAPSSNWSRKDDWKCWKGRNWEGTKASET